MNDPDGALKNAEERLNELRRRWEQRSATEKALVDEGPMTPFVLCCVVLIWAVELTANLRNGITGWIDLSHLLIIGSLELFLGGYLVLALLRKWSIGRRLRRAEQRYRSLINQKTNEMNEPCHG